MKRGKLLFPVLVALLLVWCGGCALPQGREIENMTLLRTLGVDMGGAARLSVTAAAGGQTGENLSGEQNTVLRGGAESISAAVLEMQNTGDSYLYFGHVGQLLLGEELARESVLPALEYVLRDPEMRLNTHLYLIRGRAETAIAAAEQRTGVTGRLEAMEDDADLLAWSMPRTVEDVLEELKENGCSMVPALLADGTLTNIGYAVLKDGALAGWAEGDAARGINLIMGKSDADVVEVSLEGEKTAVLRVVEAKTGVCPQFDGDRLTGVRVVCAVQANLAEGEADLSRPEVLDRLREELEAVEEARICAALELSRTLDADFLHLDKAEVLARPWKWAELQRQWSAANLTPMVQVTVRIARGYGAER